MRNRNRIEKRTVADKIEGGAPLLCFRQALGEPWALKLRSLGPKPEKPLEVGLIARGGDYIQPCAGGDIQGCLSEGRSRATKKEGLPFFNLQIAIAATPRGSVRLWYHRELLPRQIGCDLHDARTSVSSEQLPLNVGARHQSGEGGGLPYFVVLILALLYAKKEALP